MLNTTTMRSNGGFSMLEVLVTIIILAFGLLGLAALQVRVQNGEMESYQRAQALLLLDSMVERLEANRANASTYVSASTFGTGDTEPSSCDSVAVGAARDRCEWSNALKGSSEKSGGASIGAMIGARGCITQVQAPDPTAGVCLPGIYRVSVAWQGVGQTVVPANVCGQGQYGTETLRRVVSSLVTVGLPTC